MMTNKFPNTSTTVVKISKLASNAMAQAGRAPESDTCPTSLRFLTEKIVALRTEKRKTQARSCRSLYEQRYLMIRCCYAQLPHFSFERTKLM
ncbi:uncharacterized [Tachysurus ichikawai]